MPNVKKHCIKKENYLWSKMTDTMRSKCSDPLVYLHGWFNPHPHLPPPVLCIFLKLWYQLSPCLALKLINGDWSIIWKIQTWYFVKSNTTEKYNYNLVGIKRSSISEIFKMTLYWEHNLRKIHKNGGLASSLVKVHG